MNKNVLSPLLGLFASLLLAACSFGGDDAFSGGAGSGGVTGGTGGTGGSGTANPAVATVVVSSDLASISTDGSQTAVVKVLVRNADNQFLSNVPVSFRASSGGIEVIQATTDAAGAATARVSTAGDRTARTITVTATAGTISGTVGITVANPVASISLVSDSASIPTDGSAVALLRAVVRDANNEVIPNVGVAFSATSGDLAVTERTTDSTGVARATLSTLGNAATRTITVTASAGGRTATATVAVEGAVVPTVSSVEASSSLQTIPPDGSLPAVIRVLVRNASNQALVGVPVVFAASSGSVAVTQGVTDASGYATAKLTPAADTTPRTITVTASAAGISDTVDVAVAPTGGTAVSALSILSTVASLPTDGSVQAEIRVVALSANNVAMSGIDIVFATDSGQLTVKNTRTDGNGIAIATLSIGANTTPRTIRVTASTGAVSGTIDVPVANTVASIVVSSARASLPADGSETAEISAIVKNALNQTLSNVEVVFSADTGALTTLTSRTNESGVATARLSTIGNSTPRNILVTAIAAGLTGSTQVRVVNPVASVVVSSTAAGIPTDQSATTDLRVIVRGADNVALAGVPVSFNADLDGSLVVLRSVTDADGTALARLSTATATNATARNITVTATAGGVQGSAVVPVSGRGDTAVAAVEVTSLAAVIAPGGATQVSALVLNGDSRAVPGVGVRFSVNNGGQVTVVGSTVTDSSGIARANLTVVGKTDSLPVTVAATAGGITNSTVVAVVNPVSSLQLDSSVASIPTDKSSRALLSAVVLDAGNRPLTNVPVTFTVTGDGELRVISAMPDAVTGRATAELTTVTATNTTSRTLTATATAGGQVSSVNVLVTGLSDNAVTGVLVASSAPSIVPGSTAEISALVVNQGNRAVSGVAVEFTANNGGQVTILRGTTDASGLATARLSVVNKTTPDPVTVTARAASISGTVSVAVADPIASLVLSASAPSIPTDKSATTLLTAVALDSANRVIPGVQFSFEVDGDGLLTGVQPVAGQNGEATATLTTQGATDTSSRILTVSVRAGAVTATRTISVQGTLDAPRVSRVVATTDRAAITADGSAALRVLVLNADGQAIPAVRVTLVANNGGELVNLNLTTDTNGYASAVLQSTGNASPRTITVTAGAGGQTDALTIAVVNPVASVVATASQTSIPADNSSASRIAVLVRDADNRIMVGVPVSFSATGGQLRVLSTVTDATGVAYADLLSGAPAAASPVTVTATAAGLSSAVSVVVSGTGQTTVTRVAVTSSRTTMAPDGTALVQAVVLNASNQALANVPVSFAANNNGVLTVTRSITDAAGVATATLASVGDNSARTITVTATAASVTGSVGVVIAGSPAGTVATVLVRSNVSSLLPAAGASATITVQALNADNVAVAGVPVSFAVSSGELAVSSAVTDANGLATAVLSTNADATGRTITVTATAASVSGSVNVAVDSSFSVVLLSDATTLSSAEGESVTLRAFVLNAQQQLMVGVPVSFTADSGAILGGLAVTDETGAAEATLGTGGDPSARLITVTATVAGIDSSITIAVDGTTVVLSGPSSLALPQTGTYTALLRDSAGRPLSGYTVTFASSAGNSLSTTSGVTDAAGRATVQLSTVSAGADTLTASAAGAVGSLPVAVAGNPDSFAFSAPTAASEVLIGATQAVSVTWTVAGVPQVGQTVTFATTRGVIGATAVTDAAGVATVNLGATTWGGALVTATGGGNTATLAVEFVAPTPAVVEVQPADGAIGPGESTAIVALVRDAIGNPVKSQVIEFTVTDVSGGTLSPGLATTDSMGRASVVYTAGTMTSPANGVVIQARVRGTAITDTASLTVAQRALFLSMGTGNTIETPDKQTYRNNFIVQVTDANGNPVAGQLVTPQVFSTRYVKGLRVVSGTVWTTSVAAVCADEDANRDGWFNVGAGEDLNGNGRLDAGNIAAVSPANAVTDDNGLVTLSVTYPRNYAGYVEVELKAATQVVGTEYSRSMSFLLGGLASDFENTNVDPPGPTSPFGTAASCLDPN